jgi:hypothetical protein
MVFTYYALHDESYNVWQWSMGYGPLVRLSYDGVRFCQVAARFWGLAARFCRRERAKWACRRVTVCHFSRPATSHANICCSAMSSERLFHSAAFAACDEKLNLSGHVGVLLPSAWRPECS